MDNLERKQSLKSLLDCQGYKIFTQDLDELVLHADIQLNNTSSRPASGDELNFLNGVNAALNSVRVLLLSYKEELEEYADGR